MERERRRVEYHQRDFNSMQNSEGGTVTDMLELIDVGVMHVVTVARRPGAYSWFPLVCIYSCLASVAPKHVGGVRCAPA